MQRKHRLTVDNSCKNQSDNSYSKLFLDHLTGTTYLQELLYSMVFSIKTWICILSTLSKCVLFWFQRTSWLHSACLLNTPFSGNSLYTTNRNFPHMIKCNLCLCSDDNVLLKSMLFKKKKTVLWSVCKLYDPVTT